MYFILSSLLSFVCNPVFYIIVCLVLAWLVKNRIVKKVLYGVNIVLVRQARYITMALYWADTATGTGKEIEWNLVK